MAVKVGYFDSPTSPGLQSVSWASPSFTPKLVRFMGANHGVSGADQDDHHKFDGAAISSASQWAWGAEPLHDQAPSRTVVAHSNTHCIYVPDFGGTRIIDAQFVSMDANGFTINWTDAWVTPIRIYYEAIGGTECQAACGAAQALTSIGTQDITSLPFEPTTLICSAGLGSLAMPVTSGDSPASGGVGWATGSGAQYFSGWRANSGDTSQNCATYQGSGIVISFPNVAGSAPFREASLVSFLSNGFRLNWTTVNATAAWYFWIALRGISSTVGTFVLSGSVNQQITGLGRQPAMVCLQSANKAAAAGSQAHWRTSWGVATETDRWSIWGGERDHGTTVANTISATRADVDRVFRIGAENASGPSCDNHCAIDTLTLDTDGFTIHKDITTLTGQEVQFLALDVMGGGAPPPPPPPPPPAGPGLGIIISGIDRTSRLRRIQNLEIRYTLGGSASLRCELVDKQTNTQTAYRPSIDQPVVLGSNGVTLFFGYILSVEDKTVMDPNIGVVTAITCADVQRKFSHRLVNFTFPAGTTRAFFSGIVSTYLSVYNTVLDPLMANGPWLEAQPMELVYAQDALNHGSVISGMVHRLLPSNVLQVFSPGSKMAAFSITSTNGSIRGGVRWSRQRSQYINRVWIKYGETQQVEKTDTFTGNSGISAYTLTYPHAANPGYITIDGIQTLVGSGTNWVFTATQLQAVVPPATGSVIVATYTVQFPLYVMVEDSAEVTSHGPLEAVYHEPKIFDKTAATAVGTGILRRNKAVPRKLQVVTWLGPEFPGTTLSITIPERNITGSSWLITETVIRGRVDGGLQYEYTCLEGSEAQNTWLDFWRGLVGTGAATPSAATGAILPSASGTFPGDLTALGQPDVWAANLTGANATGQSYGLRIQAGSDNVDAALRIVNRADSLLLMLIRGDSVFLLGTAVATGTGAGDFVIKNGADLRAANAASTGTVSMMETNSSDQVVLSPGGNIVRYGRALIASGAGGPANAVTPTHYEEFVDSAGTVRYREIFT